MIPNVSNSGSLPTLERLLQFAGARHRLISHNIANLSTPHFRPVDVDPTEFQAALRDSIEDRQQRVGNRGGPLQLSDTRSIHFADGGLRLDPKPSGDNLLFHDGNDRDVERIMQDLVENFMVFRQAAELIRSRFTLINQAIAQRV